MDAVELIDILTQIRGVSGEETAVSERIAQLCAPFSEQPVRTDHFHNVICTIRPPKEGEPHLLLEAHLDEIGFMVSSIADDGLLRVVPCGGPPSPARLPCPRLGETPDTCPRCCGLPAPLPG